MQVIVMTSDGKKYRDCIEPFMYLWSRHFDKVAEERNIDISDIDKVFCGFSKPKDIDFKLYGWRWETIGAIEDFPANKWSDAWLHVLNNIAQPQFLLMLEDYWLCKDVDIKGMKILFGYADQFNYLLKADVATDRLHANKDFIEDYGKVGHLDLIHSLSGADYQMSLWGGIWNRDTMKRFIIAGESAQQIEMQGTTRVNKEGSDVLVIGTKQAPLVHANIYWSAFGDKPTYADPYGEPPKWEVDKVFLQEMRDKEIWKL